MDWHRQIDAYCERLGPGFWAEPVNAVTNLAFIVAALLAWRHWKARGGGDPPVLALTALTGVIGIGSFLFHTVATRWAALADVLPIQIFIGGYFLLAMRRFMGFRGWIAVLATALFLIAAFRLPAYLPVRMPGGYIAALLALAAIGLALRLGAGRAEARIAGWPMLAAAALFAGSLALRTLDGPLCPTFPLGTHFAWHMLNGTLLYVLLRIAMAVPRANR